MARLLISWGLGPELSRIGTEPQEFVFCRCEYPVVGGRCQCLLILPMFRFNREASSIRCIRSIFQRTSRSSVLPGPCKTRVRSRWRLDTELAFSVKILSTSYLGAQGKSHRCILAALLHMWTLLCRPLLWNPER
jgi:hypothetical protein